MSEISTATGTGLGAKMICCAEDVPKVRVIAAARTATNRRAWSHLRSVGSFRTQAFTMELVV
jgi:hypothetical protein